ncbi:MAG: glutamine--fructose-6-phosphate transaminase (isomerizing) [Gammaproteobacteria bacterium]
MCGIVAAVAKNNVVPTLLECLKKLEYRGYDSAGLAVLMPQGELQRRRAVGKIAGLEKNLEKEPLQGGTGIAHTRWATHGAPSETNAHPHFSSNNTIAIVHNGIIENYAELRDSLISEGYKFYSETDTEVIAHLIHKYFQQTKDFLIAVHKTASELEGMYALAILNSAEPERLIAVRSGSSLVAGLGKNGNFLASDTIALANVVEDFVYLEEGDLADITKSGIVIYDQDLHKVERTWQKMPHYVSAIDRGSYKHFMQKEIFSQPEAIADTLEGRLEAAEILDDVFTTKAIGIFPKIRQIQIIACGTSYHAGLLARYWLEEIAKTPCQVDIASEFRYKKTPVLPGTLLIAVSQSGETADTLAVVRRSKEMGYLACLAITNVASSALMREADLSFLTHAGIEIGVAASKTFTTQLVAFLLLALALGKHHGLDKSAQVHLIQQLKHLPIAIEETLALNDVVKKLAQSLVQKKNALFLGRGLCYPIALEGALKMKEISYIHAEAYAAGELKHGPLALVDQDMPVVVLAPPDDLIAKLQSNIKEVEARDGQLVVFTSNTEAFEKMPNLILIKMPKVPREIAPIVYTVPLQLLAYHVAVLKGTDVDQPRNLAKSVTVE